MPHIRFLPGYVSRTTIIGALAILGGCASLPEERLSAVPPAGSAFVLLGEGGALLARAITTAQTCPAIEIDGHVSVMAVRAPYGAIPLRPHDAGKAAPAQVQAPAPASGAVLTCETALPPGVAGVRVAGQALPLPRPDGDYRRIVVIGDTGCRMKGAEFQDCNDARAWPFARIAASAAAWKPDLVVHVGDYHYRETPCPSDRPGCAGSPWGYGWEAWQADFFAPARPLLAAAPWVVARGNHESCSRGGQGWWRFLDPHAYRPDRNCDDPATDNEADEEADYSDPYAVPIGANAQFIVFDSANTSWKGFRPGDARIGRYADTWRKVRALTHGARHSIAIAHHPLYAYGAERDAGTGAIKLYGGDAGLQQVFGALDARLLPAGVDVLLSGHVHLWEQLSFATDHPSQFVAGFAGTAEDIVPLPASAPPGQPPAPGARVDNMHSWVDGFGFMTMERTGPNAWRVLVHDRDGRRHATCDSAGRHSRCQEQPPAQGAEPASPQGL